MEGKAKRHHSKDGLWRREGSKYWWTTVGGQRLSTGVTDRTVARSVRAEFERAAVDPRAAAAKRETVGDMMLYAISEIRGRKGRVQKTVTADTIAYYERKLGNVQRLLGARTPIADVDFDRVGVMIADRRLEPGAARHSSVSQHELSKELAALRFALKLEQRRGLYPHDPDVVTRKGEFATGYKPVERHLTWESVPKLISGILLGSAQAVTQATIDRAREMRARGMMFKAIGRELGVGPTTAIRIVNMQPAEPSPTAILHAQIAAWLLATAARDSEAWRAEMRDHDLVSWVVYLRGTKTAKSAAHVPIAPPWRPYLQFALNGRPEQGPLFPRWRNINRGLALACKRAGIERVTPNDLRRTHTTLLASDPVHPIPNSALLPVSRHTTTRMLDGVYVRHTLESTMRMLERLAGPKGDE